MSVPSSNSTLVKSIVICGGTHGNETNGVMLARYFNSLLLSNPFPHDPLWKNYQSIDSLKVVFSNPEAMKQNVRYIDEDLNRCFLLNDLSKRNYDTSKELNSRNVTYERKRSQELNKILGPKGSSKSTDLIIDLHTTTSNTKINMIMSPKDEVSQQLGAYITLVNSNHKEYGRNSGFKHSFLNVGPCNDVELESENDINLTFWKRKLADYPLLPTVAKSGFTLEVGPLPWGSAVGNLYLKTQKILWQILNAVEARNRMIENTRSTDALLYEHRLHIVSTTTTFFQASECNPVNYPVFPNEDNQSNLLNIAAMIHPDFQGMDYSKILTNETNIFIALNGTTSYKFNRETMTSEEDEDVRKEKSFYPFFINESAYYEKGIAFCIAFKIQKEVSVAIKMQN